MIENWATEVNVFGKWNDYSVPAVPGGHITINGKEFPLSDEPAPEYIEGVEDMYRIQYRVSAETAKEMVKWIDSGHTIITVKNYPTCPKCDFMGEDGWEYCPHDGTRLDPAAPPERYEIDRFGKRVKEVDDSDLG